jgi:hypothetical protein
LIDVVVVYKVDRLTRSLADFAKIVEIFDAAGVSFVSVTRFLDDGRIELDNNPVERAIRPVALGRKNHLFAEPPPVVELRDLIAPTAVEQDEPTATPPTTNATPVNVPSRRIAPAQLAKRWTNFVNIRGRSRTPI